MKIDKFVVAIFSGVAFYYLAKAIYLTCSTDDLNRIFITWILCLLTVCFGAIWILHDYTLQLNNRCKELQKELDQTIEAVNLKFKIVDENLDRLYINDRYVTVENRDEILYK